MTLPSPEQFRRDLRQYLDQVDAVSEAERIIGVRNEPEASMPNHLDRFTDHGRDGNTPVIVLPEIPEMVMSLAMVVLLEMMVLTALAIVVLGMWIVG